MHGAARRAAMTRRPLGGILVGPMATTTTDTRNPRRRRAALVGALALSALLIALVGPGAAMAAAVWSEGSPGGPFHLTSIGGSAVVVGSTSDQAITLAFVPAWSNSQVAPWSVVPAPGGMLVADPGANDVRIVGSSGSGSMVADNASLSLNQPRWASPTSSGTLIADTNNSRVVEVDESGVFLRQFDKSSVGLDQPYSAVRVGTDTTLIADTGNDRVIEVGLAGKLGGQYGTTGMSGSSTNYLNSPECAIRLSDNRTIVADTGNNRLVILGAVLLGQTPIVIGAGVLNGPTSVFQTSSGTLLVADRGNNRVVEMDMNGTILAVMNSGLKAPTSAARLPDGTTAIADNGNGRLVGQVPGNSSGVNGSAVSSALDFGLAGVTKTLNSVGWNANVPSRAGLSLKYRLNGSGAWKSFPAKGVFSPPLSFTTLQYQVDLTGSSAGVPSLNEIDFNWDVVQAAPATAGTGLGVVGGTTFGGSYTGTGTPLPEVIYDNGVRRGLVMESVGTFGSGKLPGPGGLPSQPISTKQVAGLAVLGGMWGIGIALQPIGKLLLALKNIIPFPTIGGG
jgi:hypothetical protein